MISSDHEVVLIWSTGGEAKKAFWSEKIQKKRILENAWKRIDVQYDSYKHRNACLRGYAMYIHS